MTVDKTAKRFAKKSDFINIAILLAIALGVGIYLIATTVLIAKDGVSYIEQAQRFSVHPVSVIKDRLPFGYPFLIFMAHKLVVFFSNSSSVYSWICSGQAVSLSCRLLSIIALYFIGKVLVGSKNSFWAVLILIMLPYPARFGSDVLREWPHILFLATGFLFLLWGAKQAKSWMFGIAGLAAGLGHIIRPECAQLVIYGVLWLSIRLFLPKPNMGRLKLLCTLFILLSGFAIPTVPYMKARERILPPKLKVLTGLSYQLELEKIHEQDIDRRNSKHVTAGLPGNMAKTIGRLIEEISDNLMYFFVPALLIGIYSHFHKQSGATGIERFLVPAFITLNITMMILLHYNRGYISRRHSLPLVAFAIFYVPIGLQVLGVWLENVLPKSSREANVANNKELFWFFVLLAVGIAICLPKVVRPMRIEKQGYRDAAKWLKENTSREDIIAVPDRRISFYAERKGSVYSSKVPKQAKYIVRIAKNENEKLKFGRTVKEEYSACVDKRKKSGKKLVVYRIM